MNVKLKGVSQLPSGRWKAQRRVNGRLRYLGTFATAEEAHAAYEAGASTITLPPGPFTPEEWDEPQKRQVRRMLATLLTQEMVAGVTVQRTQKGNLYAESEIAGVGKVLISIQVAL